MSLSLKKSLLRHSAAATLLLGLVAAAPAASYAQDGSGEEGGDDTASGTAPESTEITVHVVQAGESLSGIAGSYGVLPQVLLDTNGLASGGELAIGQRLLIPNGVDGGASVVPVVADVGDNLYVLAARTGQSVTQLGRMNDIVNPVDLLAGHPLLTVQNSAGLYAVVRSDGRRSSIAVFALAQNASPWVLRLMNPSYSSVVPPGALLTLLPSEQAADWLPSPWQSVTLHPLPLERGRVGGLRVQTDRPGTLTVSFMASDWPTVSDGDFHYILLSIDRLAATGVFPLTLQFTADDGTTATFTRYVQVRGGGYDRETIQLAPQVAAILNDPVAVQDEVAYVRQTMSGFTSERRWDGLFRLPAAGVMSSGFGTLRSYNGEDFNTFHAGADIAGPIGTPIYAPADGVVVDTGLLEVRGFITIIDHGWGVYTGYWHQSSILVNPGDEVVAGQQIGAIGNTGLSTAAHVHWEMWVGGVQVDPMQWVREVFP